MIKTRYKKLTGLHAGHTANEFESPMHWTLQCKTIEDQKLNISEDELMEKSRWQPIG